MNYRKLPRYKYQLLADETIECSWLVGKYVEHDFVRVDDGRLTVCEGYAWDGASGPAIDTTTILRGSLFHDALYQLMRQGLLPRSYRALADDLMRELCIEDGMRPIRAWWVYWSVRLFGGRASS